MKPGASSLKKKSVKLTDKPLARLIKGKKREKELK